MTEASPHMGESAALDPAQAGPGTSDPRTVLGRAIAGRMRRPGPRGGRRRTPLVGGLAASSTRFVGAMQQTATVRRALAGPTTLRAPRLADGMAPPRWWTPQAQATGLDPRRVEQHAPNPVRRAPGRTPTTARPTTLPVRLPAEVTAAGPMVVSQDTRRRSVPPRAAGPSGPSGPGRPPGGEGSAPGRHSGTGHGQPAASHAAGPRSPAALPRPQASPAVGTAARPVVVGRLHRVTAVRWLDVGE